MKRAFTLVEMLIVVALIATLMTIVLRLTSIGSDESARNTTIVRLAKLENCLSGYYAAYGSYPPVPLHNSRSIYEGVNDYGVQNLSGSGNHSLSESELWNWDVKKFQQQVKSSGESTVDSDAWSQVRAACESQPVALEAPDPDVPDLDEGMKQLQQFMSSASSDSKWGTAFSTIYNNIGGIKNSTSWRESQLFKFGLMSFLLPRYQVMMGWRDEMFNGDGSCVFERWNDNNGAAPHDPLEGGKDTWKKINEVVKKAMGYGSSGSGSVASGSSAYLEALPSEAVTSRWMPNLEGVCVCDYPNRKLFGVTINDPRFPKGLFSTDSSSSPPLCIYSAKGSSSGCYHLNRITVLDGWRTEFFYYSPSPHQSYQLWSAGKNKRTFPPWISRQNLDANALEHVTAWTEDDIKGLSN